MPFQEPSNLTSRISVTSMVESAWTSICTSKLWMVSCRATTGLAASSVRATRRIAQRNLRIASLALLRRARLETYLRRLALRWRADLEELARLEIEHVRDHV